MHLDDKAQRLRSILQGYRRVAIAFSGGIDSSLLVKCALDTLGAGNVLPLFGRSELLKSGEIERAESWPVDNGYPRGVELEVVDLQPLAWKEFVNNSEDRCYLCKLRIYTLFRQRMEKAGFSLLLDGTNADDLKDRRAGLRAIHELGVKMPLVAAGFSKADTREYGRRLGLSNWEHPSSSCLATRIPSGMMITSQRLRRIEAWEKGMEKFGLTGCRVRLAKDCEDVVHVEVAGSDFDLLLNSGIRLSILRFMRNNGVRKVLLDLEGR
ncbi:ATP-dependent sacrificial sulfur transferase LarE [Desulfobulbus alkaliphilus]|uniref:ATP-dependent sacrificial sulfur transferase LarE n=1 Tax=Desulfobulbus alkaliphilus TaxID=869814 RepID=UPI0019641A86|nr:ATP-dependent sacrificial sulfur transferase LarE [Desulfobulbus alkaliphilus]MBM9535501.1 ATP-dependent sacrificial sulfur transferase LarE [Desulfobulbus alkaliphilus]